jgi:drug/metabolite transporter (DMT)-like permease
MTPLAPPTPRCAFARSGVALIAISSFFFSLMGLGLKELRTGLGAMEVVFFRAAISLLLTLAVIRGEWRAIVGVRWRLLVLRGVVGFAALVCYVVALGAIPFAEAVALLYTGPVFTALLASWWLREKMPPAGWAALAVCLGGSVLILQPPFLFAGGAFAWGGGAIGLASGVLSGVAYTTVRACARTERNVTIVLWYALIATLGAAVLMLDEFRWPTPREWAWIAGTGICAQLGQIYLTRGLRAQQAGTAMTGSFTIIVLAAAWGWLLFDERPSAPALAGGALVIGATVLLSRRA